jgi:ComF family protein
VCAKPLALPSDGCVCATCWAGIVPAPRVAWPASIITRAAAAGDYVGSLREIIQAFKYDGRRSLAAPLGSLMRIHGQSVLHGATHVVPVPLHPWRRLQRGFNQSLDLARTLELPVAPILWRRRRTMTQADLTAEQRWRNVDGAFAVSPLASARNRAALRGAVIVLVDDVRTTGATLHACAEVLAGVQVREVRVLTAAVRAQDAGDYSRSGSTAA